MRFMKKTKDVSHQLLYKDLRKKALNLRSCETLFDVFLKACTNMKLNWNEGWTEWSKKILVFFADLGRFYDYRVYLEPQYGVLDTDKKPTSEYLVDLCWSFEDEYARAYWIELALESELSSQNIDSIKYDFWKLTDVKAFVKVGIFAPKLKDKKATLEEISYLVASHGIQVPTEKYLVILILNHGPTELESQRIEITGYEIDYISGLREIGSKRFPAVP